jgi:hypothetical protein
LIVTFSLFGSFPKSVGVGCSVTLSTIGYVSIDSVDLTVPASGPQDQNFKNVVGRLFFASVLNTVFTHIKADVIF